MIGAVCSQACFNYVFACGDGECLNQMIVNNGVCDGTRNCSDGSDESRCGLGKTDTDIISANLYNLSFCFSQHSQHSGVLSVSTVASMASASLQV